MSRTIYSSNSPWEDVVGYSRVVKTGNIIEVAGTTASENGAVIGMHDYYKQTHFILKKIEKITYRSRCLYEGCYPNPDFCLRYIEMGRSS